MRPEPNAPYTKPKCYGCGREFFPSEVTIKVVEGRTVRVCDSCNYKGVTNVKS